MMNFSHQKMREGPIDGRFGLEADVGFPRSPKNFPS